MLFRLVIFLFLSTTFLACGEPSATERAADAEPAEQPAEPTGRQPGEKYKDADGNTRLIANTRQLPVGEDTYPAAPGFDAAGSDAKAVSIVDSLVKYHGGYAAYDAVRYISWNFMGRRALYWDKHQQRVRIAVIDEPTVYLLNYGGDSLSGRVQLKGEEITAPAQLAAELGKAYAMFINDSYWLVQHFKLKDDGVTLKYVGEANTDPQANRPSHMIDVTFSSVGDTPQNRYRLFVDLITYRVNTWQFFAEATDEEPRIETPWEGYRPYGGLLVSGERGDRFSLTPLTIDATLTDRDFTVF